MNARNGVAEGFTDEGRELLALAEGEARSWNHAYIGTEHLLLALVRREDSRGAQTLRRLGVDLAQVAEATTRVLGRGSDAVVGETPLTPRSRHILGMAVSEARRRGSSAGSDDVLLAILRHGEGTAADVLASFGVALDQERGEAIIALSVRDRVFPPAGGAPER